MPVIENKFANYKPSPETKILLVGLFTANTEHNGDFFYGKARNFLWHMLPICFNKLSLKDEPLEQKQLFMKTHAIDFADVVLSLEVPDEYEAIMEDDFIDAHVHKFANLVEMISTLPKLEAVYFTRKTFNGIPNIKAQIKLLETACKQQQIRLCKLDTPARHYSNEKQQQWIDTMMLKKTCLRV